MPLPRLFATAVAAIALAATGRAQQQIPQFGNKPYVTILVRFADYTNVTPFPLSDREALFSNAWPNIGHYFRTISYGQMNVDGSVIAGNKWYNLPRPKSYYAAPGGCYDTNKIQADAIAVADADVDFSKFYGISIVMNHAFTGYGSNGFPCGSVGGRSYMTLDGQTRLWGVTEDPPGNGPEYAHEVGHSLGLPHSSGMGGANDRAGIYNSRWDPMSTGSYWDATYGGGVPVGTISYNLDLLGWIPANRKYLAMPGTSRTFRLERLVEPTPDGYLMAKVYIGGRASLYYTFEARRRISYDIGIPGEAVIIHRVDVNDPTGRPARVVDADNNGDFNDAGAMWTPGETFTDAANGITFTVNSQDATGYNVTLSVAASVPLPWVVTNTKDDGPGSLRNAIQWANQFPGTTVAFKIPRSDPGFNGKVFTIQPATPLPELSGANTTLDAATQTDYVGNTNTAGPEVVLASAPNTSIEAGLRITGAGAGVKGLAISGFSDGLQIFGSGATATGLVVNGFSEAGVKLVGAGEAKIQGCYLGVNFDGTALAAEGPYGVYFTGGAHHNLIGGLRPEDRNVLGKMIAVYGASSNNTIQGNYLGTNAAGTAALCPNWTIAIRNASQNTRIGGAEPGAGNVIAAQNGPCIGLGDPGVTGTVIQGNLIGTNAAGTARLGAGNAIYMFRGAQHTLVGGTTPAARNVIVGLTHLWDPETAFNTISGNYIGTNASGTAALNIGDWGVALRGGAHDNTIGGSAPGAGNLISGNGGPGIGLADAGVSRNVIQGNRIGMSANGGALPNQDGVLIVQGASSNIIGGIGPGEGNAIANSLHNGVAIGDAATVGNAIRGNGIYGNAWRGIDLWGGSQNNGVTANDTKDTDTGPNNLQNFPAVQASTAGGVTTVTGTLNSTPGRTFAVDFYGNMAKDSTGYGQGETYLGSVSVTTTSSGNGSFTLKAPAVKAARYVTATATDLATGDTSEFSQAASTGFAGYTWQEISQALRISAGFSAATSTEYARLNVIKTGTSATRVDMADITRLLRSVAGTSSNP